MPISPNKSENKLIICIAFGAVLLACVFWVFVRRPHAYKEPLTVSMKLFIVNSNGCIISVSVTNNEAHKLEFDGIDLPWNFTGENIIVKLIEEDNLSKKPLTKIYVVGDVFVGFPIVFKPGEGKSENVSLNDYLTLPAVLLKHDVTLLWSYSPHPRNSEPLKTITGEVTIPHQKEGKL